MGRHSKRGRTCGVVWGPQNNCQLHTFEPARLLVPTAEVSLQYAARWVVSWCMSCSIYELGRLPTDIASVKCIVISAGTQGELCECCGSEPCSLQSFLWCCCRSGPRAEKNPKGKIKYTELPSPLYSLASETNFRSACMGRA